MRTNMCIDVCGNMCADMGADMCAHMRAHMCAHMCAHVCRCAPDSTFIHKCPDMCTRMWIDGAPTCVKAEARA